MKVRGFMTLMFFLISILLFLHGCGGDDEVEPDPPEKPPERLTVDAKELEVVSEDEITDLKFFRDVWLIASSSFEIRIYDAEKRLLALLTEHPGIVETIALSDDSDNLFIAAGCSDGTIRSWNAKTVETQINQKKPKEILRFTAQNENYYQDNKDLMGGIKTLAFSPTDSKLLASGDEAPDIKLWDIKAEGTPSKYDILTGHNNMVTTLTFSDDGTLLASGSLDEEVRVWDHEKRRTEKIFPDHDDEITALVFLDVDRLFGMTGTFLASGSKDSKIMLWNLEKEGDDAQKPIAVLPHDSEQEVTQEVTTLAFLTSKKLLVSGTSKGEIRFWDVSATDATKVPSESLRKHDSSVTALAVSSEGTKIASGSADGIIHILTEEEFPQLFE